MNPLTIIQLVAEFLPAVESIIKVSRTNGDLVSKIRALSPALATLLEGVGSVFFPKADPTIHIVGGVIAAFDPDTTKWLQGSLNVILAKEPGYVPLVVDGLYGDLTKAAVAQLQTKWGLKVDGLAGQVTKAAIDAFFAKLPNLEGGGVGNVPPLGAQA